MFKELKIQMRAILWPRLSSHADCLPGLLRHPPWQQGEEGKEGHRGSQVNMHSCPLAQSIL